MNTLKSDVTQAIPFASGGPLKMLYDNRMHPQALEFEGKVYIVWRGDKGLPHLRVYDLATRAFSETDMVLKGFEEKLNLKKYARDHHFSPVIWMDANNHFHVLSGCHGNKAPNFTSGDQVKSKRPGDTTEWVWVDSAIDKMVNYPKPYRIYDDQTVVYFRSGGHLSEWTYRISADNGETWDSPSQPTVDLDGEPQDCPSADHAGSYHCTRVGKDGKALHVAFIWARQNYDPSEKPPINPLYGEIPRFRRYNLYYIRIDLPTGKVFNFADKELSIPIRKSVADADCLVWDTGGRISPMGPSIYLDEEDRPYFLLSISAETPNRCKFHFVRNENGTWKKTPIARTSHPFNAGHLERASDGTFQAYMIVGDGENESDISKQDPGRYGWGDRVELWSSDANGENWMLTKDLTPVPGHRWQNVKCVSRGNTESIPEIVLFYGWQDNEGTGIAYLWDNRG